MNKNENSTKKHGNLNNSPSDPGFVTNKIVKVK